MSDLADRIRKLSLARRTLLERALHRRPTPASARGRIPPRDRSRPCPLSYTQERIWFFEQLCPGTATYNEAEAVRLRGPLDVEALERMLAAVEARHEILRTAVRVVDGAAVQVVVQDRRSRLERLDLTDVPDESQSVELTRVLEQAARRPFDLERDPLIRAVVVRCGREDHVLLVVLHHLVCDRGSLGILFRELAAGYNRSLRGAASALPALAIQYGDFAVWERRQLEDRALEEERAYWCERLRGAPPLLELPADRPRPVVTTHQGGRRRFQIDAPRAAGLGALARRQGVSFFTALLAGFTVLLSRYARQDDFVVGLAATRRDRPELEPLMGPLVDTLVVRADLSGEPSFRDLLARLAGAMRDAYAHRAIPFERLVDALGVERSLNHEPVFQVMVTWRDPAALMEAMRLEGLEISPVPVDVGSSKFDLTLYLTGGEGGVSGELVYSADLFDAWRIERMGGHLSTLFDAVATTDEACARLPLLTPAERRQLLVDWNATHTPYPRDASIHELFGTRVRERPEAVAVVADDRETTYADLDARASRLAGHLRGLGVGPGTTVAICLERSLELVVGLLGILKVGGVYVPLDPAYPPERLSLMLEETEARVLLTGERLADRLPECRAAVVRLDADRAAIDRADPRPAPEGTPEGLAYVMYTSGSTGRPKGVCVRHRGVVRLVTGVDYARLGPDETFLQLAPISFDASTFEVWAPLLNGGRLVIFPPGPPSLDELERILARHRVTTLWLTAALFHQVVDHRLEALRPVRQLLAGGDVLSVLHVRRLLETLPETTVINAYGPTESTTFACCYRISEARQLGPSVPIGRPIANTEAYVLDRHCQPVPVGVPGELYLGGDGLAAGYLKRPDLTADRFLPHPFDDSPGARLYRTGDLVRYHPDGNLEFLGRLDDQVKIRGHRVEPGEIEALLAAHPAVEECAVVAHADEGGSKRLVAYWRASGELPATATELRRYLKGALPDFMVPAAFVPVESFPTTPSGKIDRRALPAPAPAPRRASGHARAPRTPSEEVVAAVWAEALEVEDVGRDDDFFDLGGHSLRAIQVAARLGRVFDVEVPLRVLFENPTLADLSASLDVLRRAPEAPALPPVTPAFRRDPLPLSYAQERMWRYRAHGDDLGYVVQRVFRLRGPLVVAALERAITELVERHEALRSTFAELDGEPVQVVHAPAPVPLRVVDVAGRPDTAAAAEDVRREDARRPFDLTSDRPCRACLVRLDAAEHLLLLTLHHIAYDGPAIETLLRELAALYDASRRGVPSTLPPPGLQAGDVATWERRVLAPGGEVHRRELAYWQAVLRGYRRPLALPFQRPRVDAPRPAGSWVAVSVPAEVAVGVRALSRREGVTLFMTAMAALGALLAPRDGNDPVVVGTYAPNRTRPEIADVVVFLSNLVLVPIDVSGDPPFRELLRRVRAATLGALSHQSMPFETLVRELGAAGQPLPEVAVILQVVERQAGSLDLAGLDVQREESLPESLPWGFSVTVCQERDGALTLVAAMDTGRYDPRSAEGLLLAMRALLERIAGGPDRRLSDLRGEAVGTPPSTATGREPSA